jgi:signal transduction histidine kinase/ActR/RegA family two-component response regulator
MNLLKQPVGNKALAMVAVLLTAVAAIWLYFGYTLIASAPPSAGPQENYYLPVAQFEQAALKLENAILRYGAGKGDIDDVGVKYQVLQSKLGRLSEQSDSNYLLLKVPGYPESVAKLRKVVSEIGSSVDGLEGNRSMALPLADHFTEMRGPLADLEMSVGNAEGAMRDTLFRDYARRRRALLKTTVGVLLLSGVLIGLLLLNARRVRALVVQQRAALDREKEAAQAATEAVNARNAFLGMIGHELRTPLQSITAAIDVLVEREFPGPDGLMIKRLARAADQLDAQMKDLTDFSRINAGKLTLRNQVFVPRDVINAAVDSVSDRAARKGLRLEARIMGTDAPVVSDPYRIQQVITNLLINAIKYTERGAVTIRADVSRTANVERLTVEIEDTGPGFSEDKAAKIFQPFTQLDSSSTRRHDGIGMGLAIVRGLLTLLGGGVKVSSTVGVGTKFTVTLPLQRSIGMLGGAEDRLGESYRIEEKTVLAVDDQESMRESLRAMLSALGVRFVIASSADEALGLLGRKRFDALLLDVNMPVKDGVAVAESVRAEDGPNRRIPIIAFSAAAPELLSDQGRELFGQYLMKPIRADVLRSALDRIFAGGTRL